MELHTERLSLQPYTGDLVSDVVKLAGDEAVAATTFVPHPYTEEIAEQWISSHPEWIENRTAFPMAMILKESGDLVGTMNTKGRSKA